MTFEQNPISKTYSKIKIETREESIQQKIEAEDIKSILSASSNLVVKSFEANQNTLTANVECGLTTIFANGQNHVATVSSVAQAAPSFDVPIAHSYHFDIKETETQIEVLSATNAVATTKYEIIVYAIVPQEFSGIKCGTAGVFEQTKTIAYQTLAAVSSDKIIVVDEMELAAESIVAHHEKCTITKITPLEDTLVVDGELLVSILSEIDQNTKTTFKKVEFSSEVSAFGAKQGVVVLPYLSIENCNLVLANGGTGAVCTISATLKFDAECFANTTMDVVEDAFCEDKQLLITTSGLNTTTFEDSKFVSSELSISLSTKDKNVNMGTILAVVDPHYQTAQNGGEILCTAIYRHAETDELASCVLCAHVAKQDSDTYPQIVVKSFAKKKPKEVAAEVVVLTSTQKDSTEFVTFAQNIEEGEAYENEGHGIVVYSATKDDSLFAVAKALHVSPEMLKAQNAELPEVFAENKKVLLYRKNLAKF